MFQHLHGLLSSRQVFQLGLSDSPAGSVLRSGCSGTLAERVNALDAELAPHRETVLDGRVPALQFFRGDIHDVGKLAALKKLAEYLKEHGSILWNEAVGRFDAKKCGLCYEWFEAEQVRWDAEPYCYVCKDVEACTARRPGAQGRKRARREGSYASMSRDTTVVHCGAPIASTTLVLA